jgi:serine/threonine protein kinase
MAESLEAEDPRQAGPYRLLGRLGAGGMGRVFLGVSPGGRPVAVKIIRADVLAGNPEFRSRFVREVAAARKVNALFTAAVVNAEVDGEMPWLATQYVAGPTLGDAVAEHGPMPPHFLRLLAGSLAEGLAAIHAAGVIHRDLKPSNVLLADDGPRIIDFGISRIMEVSSLTRSGMLVGTPDFMSPEQASDGEIGPPSDVFSLGSLLVFAATGAPPFTARNTPALLLKIVNAEPALNGVPRDILPLISRCFAKEPDHRPKASEILAELGSQRHFEDWLPRPVADDLWRYRPQAKSANITSRHPSTVRVNDLHPAGADPSALGQSLPSTVTSPGPRRLRPDQSPVPEPDRRRAQGTPAVIHAGAPHLSPRPRQRRRLAALIGAGTAAAIIAAVAIYIASLTLPTGVKAPPELNQPSSKASVMSVDGVKINRSAFRLVCDPNVADVNPGDGAGCHRYTHQVSFGASEYIYLRFSGVTQIGLQRLCQLGYKSWLSDNEGQKASARDYQLQFSQNRKYNHMTASDYWIPPTPGTHVPQSGGDVCYDIKGTNPEYWQPDHVLIYNVDGNYTAVGPLAITWRLYNPQGRVIIQTTWRTIMIH